ncbi:MAG: citrate transporter [Chloroflexi bacterium]|nr:citrate transporter [Chloroflexota bacterium]MBP7043542.1 citrate transporter [Chloroflexota bacterium]
MKNKPLRFSALVSFLILVTLLMVFPWQTVQGQSSESATLITGRVIDRQNQLVADAVVTLVTADNDNPLSQTITQADGRYALSLPETLPDHLIVRIEREHFHFDETPLDDAAIQSLRAGQTLVLPNTILLRQVTTSFWIAALVFIGMLGLIALGKLHNTLAALLGMSVVFAVSYLGRPFSNDLFIFDFRGALRYVDWNVIFLIMGMMIIIAVVERTGVFQWLAFAAYRLSRGRIWLLVIILMGITGIASATLDNVTTMLLMTPITVQIALALSLNPLALLIPEVLASNVAGISTLIGTPTNILIGSYAKLSFNDFLTNLTPGVLLAMVGLIIYCEFVYRHELRSGEMGGLSTLLLDKLAERAKITEPEHLKKAGIVGFFMLVLFVMGERIHLIPAVTALMGATALLVWIRPDIEEMIEAVDWTTLVFFIGLFVVVGAVQEVGLISFIADGIGRLVGSNLLLAVLAVTWFSALLSTVIANIPFTAAMLPVIGYLTATIPGAQNNVLFYCLSVGAAMGGNGSLIGASANMVTSGIADRAGYPITYAYFFKKGFPALLITVSLATLWLVFHFL